MSNPGYYYYKNRGQVLGPFDLAQIQQRARRAQINSRSEVSTDGFSWQPAQSFPEIFSGNLAAPPVGAVTAVAAAPEEAADWHYMRGGEQQGPVTKTMLKEMIGLGDLSQSDHVWKDGMSDWREIGQVPDLASQAPLMPAGPSGQAGGAPAIGGGLTAFCTSCGQMIPREAAMCVHCGVPNKVSQDGTGASQSNMSGKGLISVGYVLSLIALFLFPPAFGLAAFIVAIVNLVQGRIGHGIVQIVLSVVCTVSGMLIGAAMFAGSF